MRKIMLEIVVFPLSDMKVRKKLKVKKVKKLKLSY